MVRWASSSDFASARLWLGPIPDLFEHSIQRFLNWLDHQEGHHWQAWTSWYLRRLEGRPVNCELELARALELTEEEWAETALANRRLLEIEHRFAGIDEALGDGRLSDGDASEDVPLPRGAAPWRFYVENGTLYAAPLVTAAENPELADQLAAAALKKAEAYAARVAGNNIDKDLEVHAQALVDLLRNWSEAPHAVALWQAELDLSGDRSAYDSDYGRSVLAEDTVSKMEALSLSLEALLGLYPDVRDIRASIARHRMTPGAAALFVEQAADLEARLGDLDALVGDTTVDALKEGRERIEAARELANQLTDAVRQAEAERLAIDASVAHALTVGDLIYELIDASNAHIERQGHGVEASPDDEPITLVELGAKITRRGQDWVEASTGDILNITVLGAPTLILLAGSQPVMALVTGLPLLARYLPAMDRLTAFVNSVWRRKE